MEGEIFNHLFEVAKTSRDPRGVVAACLVRNGEVLYSSASSDDGRYHAEYMVLKQAEKDGLTITPEDVLCVTMQPCLKRNPDGPGSDLPSCSDLIVRSGVKQLIYGMSDPVNYSDISKYLDDNGVSNQQAKSQGIVNRCIKLFESTRKI